jgi:uncharacterized protein
MAHEQCSEEMPELLAIGVRQFNAGEFYECHDTLEELWMGESGQVRDLYKGILQIGVAMYHERRGNRKGALRLLQSGIALVKPFSPNCRGVDVASLAEAAQRALVFLEEATPEMPLPADLVPHILLI